LRYQLLPVRYWPPLEKWSAICQSLARARQALDAESCCAFCRPLRNGAWSLLEGLGVDTVSLAGGAVADEASRARSRPGGVRLAVA
jgi:hypothetical protein